MSGEDDIHRRPTPLYTEVPEEPPTKPALPGARIRCYVCLGEKAVLTILERNEDGTVAKAISEQCRECMVEGNPTGYVSREQYARHHALGQGRRR
jgi:hypothetical protein